MNNIIENIKLVGVLKIFDKVSCLVVKRFLEFFYFNNSLELVKLFLEIFCL